MEKNIRSFSHKLRCVDGDLLHFLDKMNQASRNYVEMLKLFSQKSFVSRSGTENPQDICKKFKRNFSDEEKTLMGQLYVEIISDTEASRGILGLICDKDSTAGTGKKGGRSPAWKKEKDNGNPDWEAMKEKYDISKKEGDKKYITAYKLKKLGILPFSSPQIGLGIKGKKLGVGPYDRLAFHAAVSAMDSFEKNNNRTNGDYIELKQGVEDLQRELVDVIPIFQNFENTQRQKQETYRITKRSTKSWSKIKEKLLNGVDSMRVLKQHKCEEDPFYLWVISNENLWEYVSKYIDFQQKTWKLSKSREYSFFPELNFNFWFNKEDVPFKFEKDSTEAKITISVFGKPKTYILVNSKQNRHLKYEKDGTLQWYDKKGNCNKGKLTCIQIREDKGAVYATLVVDVVPRSFFTIYNTFKDRKKSSYYFIAALNKGDIKYANMGSRALAVDLGLNPLLGCSVFELEKSNGNFGFPVPGMGFAVHKKSFMVGKRSKKSKLRNFKDYLYKIKKSLREYKIFDIKIFSETIKEVRKTFYRMKRRRGLDAGVNSYVWIDVVSSYISLMKTWDKLNVNVIAKSEDVRTDGNHLKKLWRYYSNLKKDICRKIARLAVNEAVSNKCDYILLENLGFSKTSSLHDRAENKMIAKWAVNGIMDQIKSLAKLDGLVVVEVDAKYNSQIDAVTNEFGARNGNLLYLPDGRLINCQLSSTWMVQKKFWTKCADIYDFYCKKLNDTMMVPYINEDEGVGKRIKGAIKELTNNERCVIINDKGWKLKGITLQEYNKLMDESVNKPKKVRMFCSGNVWRESREHWDRISRSSPIG